MFCCWKSLKEFKKLGFLGLIFSSTVLYPLYSGWELNVIDGPKSNSLHTAGLKSNDFEKQLEGWKRHFKLEIAGHCEIYFLLQLGMGGL